MERELERLTDKVDKLEDRVDAIEVALRYDVVRREGPVVEEIRKTAVAVSELTTQIATKREIEQALAGQTRNIAANNELRLSRATKIVAGLSGLGLLALNLLQVLHP